MNAQEYLEELYFLYNKIRDDKREVERLKGEADKRTSSLSPDKVQSSGSNSKMADKVCEWVVIEQQIAEDEVKMQEILNTLNMIKPFERTILYKKYKYDKSLDEVAREIKRSYSSVSKAHTRGLEQVQKILDERKPRA